MKVSDRLPAGLTLVRGATQKERKLQLANGSVCVSVGQISAKGAKSVTLVTEVAANQQKGVIINTAKVSATNAPTVLASASILVLGSSSEVAPAVAG